jgi:hypothetical protein
MPRNDPLKHAREAWGQERNPYPAAAIAGENSTDQPYDAQVLEKDREQFIEKLIVKAAVAPGREFGYLWSLGRRNDTGYGKTRLMLETRKELNADLGEQIVKEYGAPKGTKLGAVWASMKTTGVSGIYPLLFNTIVDAATAPAEDQPSLIQQCWHAIAQGAGLDPEDSDALSPEVLKRVQVTRRKLFRGYPELRDDITEALSSCDLDNVVEKLEGVTQAGRTRNGLAYFEAFYTLVRAAGVDHLFVLVDQLEDLATAKNIPRSTRQREVGRFRDIFAETAGFRGNCHAIFTFHRRAAIALADFWVAERINPPFEPKHPIGRNACVVLSGLTSTRQVERLLTTYGDAVRQKPQGTAEPFDPSTFQLLLDRSEGRIGQLLPEACALWDRAAEAQLPSITADFVQENLPETEDIDNEPDAASDEDTLNALWNR